jgi:hypothetical protein
LLEEQAVALLPGSVFGHAPEELTARLSYVDFDGAEALRHVGALDESKPEVWIEKWVPNLTVGVQRIAGWLK